MHDFKNFYWFIRERMLHPICMRCVTMSRKFFKLYSNIEHFTQQGMEKYNDKASKDYFRSTNHQGTDALEQLFLKQSRVQFLSRADCERVKKSYKCSNCLEYGHTLKTCMAKCRLCQTNTCCAHLVKQNGKWLPSCSLP